MRTKAEKKHKKAPEEKLKLSLPSPKVVLNANECARLLDGIGKTSVLLVEKGGKMVAATTVVSLPPSDSSSSNTGSATNTKGSNSLGPHMTADSKSTLASIGKSNSPEVNAVVSSNNKKAEDMTTAAKVILKPPKKRRGNDKKFEEILQTSPVVNNGDIQHPISPLRELADGRSSQSKTDPVLKSGLPLKAEAMQKHSVESLLQPSSLASTNNLLLGGYSHHTFDPRRHHLPQTPSFTSSGSISQSNSSDGYPTNAPYHNALAQPSSQLYNHSSFTTDGTSQSMSSLAYGVTNSQTAKTVPYNANVNQTSTYLNKRVTNDHAPALSLPLLVPSSNNGVAHSPSFQQLPEQEEPMNLSKSCKPVLSLVTIQSHVSVNESRTAEDVSRGFVLQHSPAHGQTQSAESRESPSDMLPEPLPVKKAELKKSKKKRVPKGAILPHNPPKVQPSNHTVDELIDPCNGHNKIVPETSTKSVNSVYHKASPCTLAISSSQVPNTHAEDTELSDTRQQAAEINQQQHNVNLIESNQKQPSTYLEGSPKASPPLSEPLELAVHSEPLSLAVHSEPLSLAVDPEPLSLAVHSEPLSLAVDPEPLSLAVHSDPLSSAVDSEHLPMSCEPPSLLNTQCSSAKHHHLIDHPSSNESMPKSKRSPKKKVEIPMDEVSCANRISCYLETIDDVIANFVYIPGALEELKLRDEEAAILEEIHDNSVREKRSVSSGTANKVHNETGSGTTSHSNQAHGETGSVTTSPSNQAHGETGSVMKSPDNQAHGETGSVMKSPDYQAHSETGGVMKSPDNQAHSQTGSVGILPRNQTDGEAVSGMKSPSNQVHGETQTDLFDEPPSKRTFKSLKPPKKRPNVIIAKNHFIKRPAGQEAQNTMNHIDSVLAFVAADILNSTPPMESGLGDIERQKNSSEVHQIMPGSEGKIVSETETNADNNRQFHPENVPSSRVVASDSKESATENTQLIASKSDLTNFSIKNNVGKEEEKNTNSKPKKNRKKQKSDLEKLPALNKQAVPDTDLDLHKKDSNFTPKKKKKAADNRPKVVKKKKGDNVPLVPNSEAISVPEKDILSTTRAETSDIGESIASTSGGSEQDTPVHEPESKDELVSSDSKSADKENQDTGLESGGDDNKPVRRYKKRLDFVKCAQCDHQARGRSALSRHMKKVHMMDVNMPYKCHQCDYGCTKMASLNRHLFTHGVYPCSRCSFVADERSKLGQHVMELHKDKLDMKLCKVCNRYIKCDQLTIEEHADACQGPTPFKCSECEKEFKYASSLRVHYHTHFPDQPKRFKCEQCDYRTNYKANLHKHHKNMHASRDRDVQCPECGKLFSTEDNMRRHRKVHTLVRPFGCEICKKTFKTSGALKGHHLIHTATRPYTCNIPGCNRSFRTPKFLKSHQEEFHRLVPKKFFCSVDGCNYSFFKRSHLKRHAITHTGERNFHCTWPACNKSFRHADNLKVHFRSHTNEKPVQCHLCDFKCKQKNSLFWHKKKVHQIIDASVCPKRMESKLKSMDLENCHDLSESQSTQSESEQGPPVVEMTTQNGEKSHGVEDCLNESATVTETQAVTNVREDCEEERPVAAVCEQSISTQTPISRERGPKDLYEFNSEDEFEEETPGNFRRDKTAMTTLTPLPPPPKELLRKNEILEMKEKEKKEKAEKRELEKKEKAEKKEQEKKERADKKEQEKKEKADKKEQEKKERAEKKEQEKKEKADKKELEKKEKADKKLSAKKPSKKKLIKTEVVEREENVEATVSSNESPEKGSKDVSVDTTSSKPSPDRKPKVKDESMETTEDKKHKKAPNSLKRRRPIMKSVKGSPPVAVKEEANDEKEKTAKGRKKKGTTRDVAKIEKVTEDKDEEMAVSPPKRKKITSKKRPEENPVTLPLRNSAKKLHEENPVTLPPRNSAKKLHEENPVTLLPRNSAKKFHEENAVTLLPRNSAKKLHNENPVTLLPRNSAKKLHEENPVTLPPRNSAKKLHEENPVTLLPRNSAKKFHEENPVTLLPRNSAKKLHEENPVTLLPRNSAKKLPEENPVTQTPRHSIKKSCLPKSGTNTKGAKKKLVPPKRKPSARIKAKKKATAKTKGAVKGGKSAGKKKLVKKKSSPKSKQEDIEESNTEVNETIVEVKAVEKKVSPRRKSEELKKVETKTKSESEETVATRPLSPAYSEEIMLQGKASPYRDFSDADMMEEEGAHKVTKHEDAPCPVQPTTPEVLEEVQPEVQEEREEIPESSEADDCEEEKSVPQPADESSDGEVSNDIPLTPPRAPAPPPMESSEDEMDPEPDLAPISVPGPNTPFSVPAPNTPFSVPPPTNLLQQHSVHSEEAPMSAVPSVPSMEMHSQGSVEMQQPVGSVEMHSHGSVEMSHPHGSVEMNHPHGSVEMLQMHGSVEMNHPHGSVEMLQMHGSVEMSHSHGSVEMHPHNTSGEMHHHSSVEMRPHGSVEMRPHGSVEMRPHGSVEMRPHGSVEMRPHGSVEMRPHGSVEMRPHGSVEMRPHGSVEIRSHGSVEMVQSLSSVEMHGSLQEPMSQSEQQMARTPDSGGREMKYDLLPPLQDQAQTSEADKEYFDQYLKSLSAANNRAANGGLEPPTSGLRELEAMVGKSHHDLRELGSKSPIGSLPTGVITSLESTLPILASGDLRARMDVYERHHESLYVRDTPSSLPRLSDRQTATPLAPNSAAFDAFSSLNSLHPGASGRDNTYLRQTENLFPTPPVTSNFMAEAMFQRQAMTTPFLPPQPSDRSGLSRIPDTTPLRSNSTSLLRRSGTMPGADMFSSPSMPQAMPRNPFTNAWASQESRPTHWQTPYLPRQPNMTSAGSFFPSKDNYLTGREFMFDPSVRQSAERGMFPSLSSGQTQDTFQLERFDLSNYFPNAMTPYGSSTGTLDYTRSAHPASAKPFDERYRQSAAASASIPDFRGLPPSTGSSDMFSGLPGVNSGLFYASNPMSYHHTQHMTDNVNSAFLTHSTSAQHAMFERDFAAHRGLYPQNTPYPFIDERQYGPPGKLTHTHSVASAPAPQDRDLMSRSGGPEAPMQDPYRSMLYRY